VRTLRDYVRLRNAGDPLIKARCAACKSDFAAITTDADATVDHRCATSEMGPAWTLVNSRSGRLVPKPMTWAQHLAVQQMQAGAV